MNKVGTPTLTEDPDVWEENHRRMKEAPYKMGPQRRPIVLQALVEVCDHKSWLLVAAHVRTTHVHAVVEAPLKPEPVMNAFKGRASYLLNQAHLDGDRRRRWERHGSTEYLWEESNRRHGIAYVVEEQGEPMAVYLSPLAEQELRLLHRSRGSEPRA